jgi:putative component of toxin-antitoxin plasmid stabilization module
VLDVREYLDESGRSPFGRWFGSLNPTAAAKVTIALARLGQSNLSNVKGVGDGVLEYRIDLAQATGFILAATASHL